VVGDGDGGGDASEKERMQFGFFGITPQKVVENKK